MKTLQQKKPNVKSKLTPSKRDAVFRKWGQRCYYPGCTLAITEKNYLCVHDITDTGQHTRIDLMRPVCMTHHNKATADNRAAEAALARFRAQGIKIGTNENFLFEKDFYGDTVRN